MKSGDNNGKMGRRINSVFSESTYEKRILKLGECQIFEYCPIIAGGFEKGCGEVEAQMLFATPYEKDEDVVVMIGIVTEHEDDTRTIEWYAFEGEGMELLSDIPEAEGRIKVELPEEMVLLILERNAMLAIISD